MKQSVSERMRAAWRLFKDYSPEPPPEDKELTRFKWLMFRFEARLQSAVGAVHSPTEIDDAELVQRIIDAYRISHRLGAEDPGSGWSNHFSGLKASVHETLLAGRHQSVTDLLRNPDKSYLFYGFEDISLPHPLPTPDAKPAPPNAALEYYSQYFMYDCLVRFAEAVAAKPMDYPAEMPERHPPLLAVDDLVDRIERRVGPLQFPTFYPGEGGLKCSRGIIGYRALQALLQAHLVKSLLPQGASRSVVEIGAGLGRTAYFAQQLTRTTYTIVDLPLTGAAQAYFLGRSLGPDRISLLGESHAADVRIVPPSTFFESSQTYDLSLNVDSFTEMTPELTMRYMTALSDRSPALLSINHEFNSFSMRDIYDRHPEWKVERTPYWLRQGYAQEVIRFRP